MTTLPHAAVDVVLEDTLDLVAGCRRHVNTAHADVWEYVAAFCDAAAAKDAELPASGFVHAWPYGVRGPRTSRRGQWWRSRPSWVSPGRPGRIWWRSR